MGDISKSVSVAICIATYKRPTGLQRLINSLRQLKFCKSAEPDMRLVVVDNDASSPSKSLVDGFRDDLSFPLIYGIESKRGIASARNRAVQLAGDVDFIAFIDDDEIADSHWLDELLHAQNNFGVDVVNGPVLPRFEQPVPMWVQKGHFYNRRRFQTGTKIQWANTGNVLIRSCWLQSVPGPFNENLNLTGGEDTLFSSQIYRMGAKMVWSDEAIVEEYNPPSRVSARWILTRAYRRGTLSSITELMINLSIRVKMIRILLSFKHIIGGFLLLIPATIYSGYAGLIRSLMYISVGIGEISVLTRKSYKVYRKTLGG